MLGSRCALLGLFVARPRSCNQNFLPSSLNRRLDDNASEMKGIR